jgi:hypothetical protein
LCVSYSFLDASNEDYQEEEEVYYQEEEYHFDQYNNQGKLIFLQSAKLYKALKGLVVVVVVVNFWQALEKTDNKQTKIKACFVD